MRKQKFLQISLIYLAIALFSVAFFVPVLPAEAKKSKVTKWQRMLERNGVDRTLWQKYLPKVSRGEYKKVAKILKRMSRSQGGSVGPDITVGLIGYTESDLRGSSFRIQANKDYNIRNRDGAVLATIPAATETKVKYSSGETLEVYQSIVSTLVEKEVGFDAVDGNNSDLIFDINKPGSDYDRYRGKMKLRHYDGEGADTDRIWAINTVPLEHYVWGMGETTGTGPDHHVRVMTTIFRTYGRWKIEYGTKYAAQGFKVDATSSSQIYRGYDWEIAHPRIREAAEATRGKLVMYKGEVALTPYCSYTDGRTRDYPDDDYPYLKSVKDHKTGTKSSLNPGDGGNHMWGVSAYGALGFAKDGKSWDWILRYYYTGVDIANGY